MASQGWHSKGKGKGRGATPDEKAFRMVRKALTWTTRRQGEIVAVAACGAVCPSRLNRLLQPERLWAGTVNRGNLCFKRWAVPQLRKTVTRAKPRSNTTSQVSSWGKSLQHKIQGLETVLVGARTGPPHAPRLGETRGPDCARHSQHWRTPGFSTVQSQDGPTKGEKAAQTLKEAKRDLETAIQERMAAEVALEEVTRTFPEVEQPEVVHSLTETEVLHLHRLTDVTLTSQLGEIRQSYPCTWTNWRMAWKAWPTRMLPKGLLHLPCLCRAHGRKNFIHHWRWGWTLCSKLFKRINTTTVLNSSPRMLGWGCWLARRLADFFWATGFSSWILALGAFSAVPKRGSLNVGAWNPQESGRKKPLFCSAAFSMLHCSFSLAAVQLLVKTTSALQKSECCSATSAVQFSENCSATSV